MADYNLFPEDICLAIKRLLSDPAIEVPAEDKTGSRVTYKVSPKYIKPEPELVIAEYPSLVFYESSVYPDLDRMTSGDYLEDNHQYDSAGNLTRLDVRPHPAPHTVLIDIRAYTSFNQQRDIIRKEIYRRLQVPVSVLNVNGIPIRIRFVMEQSLERVSPDGSGEQTTDLFKGTLWRFQTYTYFDVAMRRNLPTVRDVIVNTP